MIIESAIQGWAYLGEFARGIDAYNGLRDPSPKDDRWLGVCYFQLFEDMRAQEAFYRSLARGEEAARVNLAHLLRFIERSEEAAMELAQVEVSKLSHYDRVLFHRVSSLHEEANGNMWKAQQHAESAWSEVQGIPEYPLLAPSVLAQLGIIYGRVGQGQRALWFLDRGLELTKGLERLKVQLRRAMVLLNLGRIAEAEAEIESLGNLTGSLASEQHFLLGELYWTRGNVRQAVQEYSIGLDVAIELAAGAEEFLIRLPLAVLLAHEGDFTEAQEHIARARILISDRSDHLLHRFREVVVQSLSGRRRIDEHVTDLQMLANDFHAMGTLQEEACVRLYLIAAYIQRGDSKVLKEVSALERICETLETSSFLERDLLLLPEVRQLIFNKIRLSRADVGTRLQLTTLNSPSLMLDNEKIRLPLRRTPELLAYFVDNEGATMERILEDLFPGVKARSAKSYFHQFRFQLKEAVPGVEIEYDRPSRLYRLKSSLPVEWDVEDVRAGRWRSATAEFLPSADSPWAKRIRAELANRFSLQMA